MTRQMRLGLLAVAGFAAFSVGTSRAEGPDDDLALVKRALQSPTPAPSAPAQGTHARWIHVRVEGKGAKKEKVSVNVPLSLIQVLGENTVTWHGRDGNGKKTVCHLADLLKSLEAGQQIVEVEDEESTIKVWVD
jgi:hypothetical protein